MAAKAPVDNENAGAVELDEAGEIRLEELLEDLHTVIWEAEPDTLRPTYVSPGVEKLLGYAASEWLEGEPFWKRVVHPQDLPAVRAAAQTVLREQRSLEHEFRVMASDGRVVWLRNRFRLLLDDHGRPRRLRGIAVDISAQKREQEILRDQEERYRSLVENSAIGFYRTTPDGRVLQANPAVLRMLGYASFEELARLNLEDGARIFEPSYDRRAFREQLEREGEIIGLEAVWRRRDGAELFVRENTRAVRNADGSVAFYEGTVEDVTQRKRAEERLRVSDEILQRVPALVLVADREGQITYVSTSAREILGYAPEELLGDGWWHHTRHSREERAREKKAVAQCARGELPVRGEPYERMLRHRNGQPRWILWHDSPGPNDTLIGVGHDITERKLAEQKLKERTSYLHALIENSPLAIVVLDPEQRVQMCNRAFTLLFGYRQGEILGGLIDEFLAPPELKQEAVGLSQQAIAGQTVHAITRRRRKDGTMVEVEVTGVPLTVEGRMVGGIGIYQDITERLRAEEALRESEKRFRQLFESAADAIFLLDMDGRIVDANQRACQTLGYSHEALVQMKLSDIELDPEQSRISDHWRRCELNAAVTAEGVHRRSDGTTFPVEVRVSQVVFSGTKMLLALARDVTERKRAEQQLKERTAYLNALLENSPLAIAVHDAEGRVQICNPAFERLFGCRAAEAVGRPLDSLVTRPAMTAEAGRLSARVSAGEFVHLCTRRARRDGSVVDVEVYGVPLKLDGRLVGGFGIYQDITERLQAEEALREANHLLQTMIQTSPLAIIALDKTGRVKLWNHAAEKIYGWSAEEALDRALPIVPEGKQEEFRQLLESELEGRSKAGLPLQRQRQDGSLVDVRLWTAPLCDAGGEPWGVMGIMEDITEKLSLEEQLRQAQKMEAVGRLAGGVAHDFNNLLMVITGYAELLLDRLPEDSPLRRNAQEIYKAADRAATLTRQLLAFSRKQVLQPRVLNLNAVVGDMERMLRRLIPENIELTIRTDPGLGSVRADPGQMEQVILNLAVNARDAMPGGGKLILETANTELDRAYALMHSGVEPGPHVLLAVSDTGCGMDPETVAHIFEPFFTTKDKSKGTGLGLSTVYGVVKQSGGHVTVYSEVGRGSTFKIYLPRVDAPCEAAGKQELLRESPSGSETLLLVEDEDGVRELTEDFLRCQGYQVLAARNGAEALELAGAHPGPIHLVLTDVIMPGMSGRELADRLEADRPGIRVLFASGYTDAAVLEQNALKPGARFLQKPFQLHELAKKVREALENS